MPYISIIVPMYNCSKYIEKCIESVLLQTYGDFELILINDGSNDDTNKICLKYATVDKRIIYHFKSNEGVSATRNYGLSIAKGEWIIFIDADDYIEPQFVSKFIESINCSINFYVTNTLFIDGQNISKDLSFNSDIIQKNDYIMNALGFSNTRIVMGKCARTVWGKLFNKSIIDKYNIRFDPSIKIGEDLLFIINYVKNINEIKLIDYYGYNYVINNESAMNKYQVNLFYNYYSLCNYIIDSLKYNNENSLSILSFMIECMIHIYLNDKRGKIKYKKNIKEWISFIKNTTDKKSVNLLKMPKRKKIIGFLSLYFPTSISCLLICLILNL